MMKSDFRYIFRRVLAALIITSLLFFIRSCNVKALEVNGSYYTSPPNVRFYGNSSSTSHTNYAGTFNASYGSWSSAVINNLGGSNDIYGADVCISMDSAMQKNYLYSISVILNNANAISYQVVSTGNYTMMRGGYDLSSAINNSDSIKLKYFGSSSTITLTNSLSNQGFIMNYIFVPNNPYHVLCLPFKTSSNVSMIHNLLGYHIDVIGNTSNLTEEQVDEVVASALSTTNTKIDNLSGKLSIVEQNLATQVQQTKYELNRKLDDINDTINDDSTDDPDSKINEASGKLATNNVISELVLLPVTLFTKVLNSLNGTCSSYSLGTLYNHQITLPCIDVSAYIGSTLWGVIDILISGLFIYAMSRKFVKLFNELSQMKEGDIID